MYKPTPMFVCVDVIVYQPSTMFVLMIRRKNPPFKGMYAFPGGYIEPHQTAKEAAVAELFEETDLQLVESQLTLLDEFSSIDRDPRGRVLSLAFYHLLEGPLPEVKAKDDAFNVLWAAEEVVTAGMMAFDHLDILNTFCRKVLNR